MTGSLTAGESSAEVRGASPKAIQQHYDLSTEFFRLWLDPSMTYSCARWDGADSLEQAQERKLQLLAGWAEVDGASGVLDIGCGWGSMLRHLVDDRGVGKAVGLTLSQQQHAHIEATRDARITARLEGWEDHLPEEPYDAIVCVGALEHFVPFARPRHERVEAYRRFFERCRQLLRPGGAIALQTIAKGNAPLDAEAQDDLMFIAGRIFPESDVPRLAELCHAAEKRFEVLCVVNDRVDYARTCGEWLQRLKDHRADAVELVGEQAVILYERYLRCSVRQFERGQTTLLRMRLRRV
jgi:cyclopropane-fatty-acyl-phospholipid synthase